MTSLFPVARHCHVAMLYRFVPPRKRGRYYSADCANLVRQNGILSLFGRYPPASLALRKCTAVCADLGMTLHARYIRAMAKTHAAATEKVVRDSKSGRSIVVRGAGALKGHLTLKKGVDLTKPIASQAVKGSKARKAEPAHAKH